MVLRLEFILLRTLATRGDEYAAADTIVGLSRCVHVSFTSLRDTGVDWSLRQQRKGPVIPSKLKLTVASALGAIVATTGFGMALAGPKLASDASLSVAHGRSMNSVLAMVKSQSIGPTAAGTDTEINDRSADMHSIYAIEDRAEAVAEGEKSGRLAIVAGRESIAKWPSLRTTLAQKGASPQELAQMDTRMKQLGGALHDPLALKRAANDVTGALAPLFAVVGETIPADVHNLDYLGRSIGLDASAVQWGRASADAYSLERAWLHLKPVVAGRPNSAKAVTAFDAAVLQARDGAHDRNAKETQNGATAVGNAVDTVENLYK